MRSLLRFEFRKLVYYKTSFFTAAALILFGVVYSFVLLAIALATDSPRESGVGHMVGALTTSNVFALYITVAVIISIFVAKDLQSGTVRHALTANTNRLKVFAAKNIAVLSFSIITFCLFYIITTLLTTALTGWGSSAEYNTFWYASRGFLLGAASFVMLVAIGMLFSFLFRNTLAAMLSMIGLYFIETVGMSIINNFESVRMITEYFPSNVISNAVLFSSSKSVVILLIEFAVIMIACTAGGFLCFRKKDIK